MIEEIASTNMVQEGDHFSTLDAPTVDFVIPEKFYTSTGKINLIFIFFAPSNDKEKVASISDISYQAKDASSISMDSYPPTLQNSRLSFSNWRRIMQLTKESRIKDHIYVFRVKGELFLVFIHFTFCKRDDTNGIGKKDYFPQKMLGGNNSNTALPVFLDENRIQYAANASNQLQLFGNIPVGCTTDPVNYFGSEHNNTMFKRGREAKTISRQQKLQISLNHNICHDEADQTASIPIQNPVSTGLRLSYDDDELNSSITSASGSMTAMPPIISSLCDNLRTELDRQKEEFDQYIKIQEENLVKGVKDIKQRHMVSFLTAMEKSVGQKLHEKDFEIENINRKNRELVERIKQVATEAQNWHYRAKYNESVVNILKTNLQQALSQGAEQMKEGFGDSDIDDTASCNPNNLLSMPCGNMKSTSMKDGNMICRVCKGNEVSFLLIPCRHLCLCKDCEGLVSACPVCQLMKTASVRVYLS